jgi:hypothetical protein
MIGRFGIRGVGSLFYLLFAIRHGVTGPLAQELVTLTLAAWPSPSWCTVHRCGR